MIKRKLSKAEFDALPETLKMFYKVDGDSHVLQIETSADDDPGELRRARDREKQAAKEAKEELTRTKTELETLRKSNGDVATLEKSWRDKTDAQKTEYEGKLTKVNGQLEKLLVKDAAQAIATDLAGDNAYLMLPHVEARLRANLEGESASTRVLDGAGNISALSTDDLKKEFVANSKFSAIIVASKASGGATGKGAGSSAVPGNKKFNELTDAERVAWHKSDPNGFASATKQAREEALASVRRF